MNVQARAMLLVSFAFVGVLAALTSSVRAGHPTDSGDIARRFPSPGFSDPGNVPPVAPSSLNYAAFAVIIALAGSAAVWLYRIEARRPHTQEESSS